MKVSFARSLSGHDAGRIYLIRDEDGRFAYLADGESHTLEKPKKKNKKHYQEIKRIPEHITEQLFHGAALTDGAVRRAVKEYERFIKEAGGK